MTYSLMVRGLCLTALACAAQSSFAQSTTYTVTPVPPLATGASVTANGLNVVGSNIEVVGSGTTSTAKNAPLQAFSASGLSSTSPGTGTFTDTDLGALSGTSGNSLAFGLNPAGQVAGWSSEARSVQIGSLSLGGHAVVTQSTGGWLDLGTLKGAPFGSTAAAINATGEVAGTSELDLLHAHAVAVATTAGTASTATTAGSMTDLGALVPLNSKGLLSLLSQSVATGVNANGTVVGWSLTSGLATHAFAVPTSVAGKVVTAGAMSDLGTLAGASGAYSVAKGINGSGVVVGASTTSTGATHAFSLSPTSGTTYPKLAATNDLGTLGTGLSSQANAINDSGVIVGTSTTAPPTAPTKQVPNPPPPPSRAFIYSSGQMTELDMLPGLTGWVLTSATGIDSNGDILAVGSNNGGATQTVVLTPPVALPTIQQEFQNPTYLSSGSLGAENAYSFTSLWQGRATDPVVYVIATDASGTPSNCEVIYTVPSSGARLDMIITPTQPNLALSNSTSLLAFAGVACTGSGFENQTSYSVQQCEAALQTDLQNQCEAGGGSASTCAETPESWLVPFYSLPNVSGALSFCTSPPPVLTIGN